MAGLDPAIYAFSGLPMIVQLQNLIRTYKSDSESLTVLNGASLALNAGEIVALVAPSGSGKSTLLHLAGLLEKPDGGAVIINGTDAGKLGDTERTEIRLRTIGIVYQFHHLLAEFSAMENIVLPQMIAGKSQAHAEKRAMHLLGTLGLAPRANHLPGKLSGGEQQRVAIARALANEPAILLADEPTGNLDVATAEIVFTELLRLVRSENTAALIATHNPDLAQRMDRQLTLREGKLV
jgi:lipoprotein-releasing system ATP-binding protein